jgi:hypothetical protein
MKPAFAVTVAFIGASLFSFFHNITLTEAGIEPATNSLED